MLKKRIIFTLLVDNGQFMLSRNFRLQKVGDINWLIKNYNFENISSSIDELIVLNVSQNKDSIESFISLLYKIGKYCSVPLAVGGLIRCTEDAFRYLQSGADKLVLNTPFYENPDLISDLVNNYGSQAIVAAVDWKIHNGENCVFSHAAKINQGTLTDHITRLNDLGAGELYLNSIDNDGTGKGYTCDILQSIESTIKCPVIMAGGAGHSEHLSLALTHDIVSGVATANLFNFIGNGLLDAREKLISQNYPLADFRISQQESKECA